MIEKINETSSQIHVSVAYIGNDPAEKARREKKECEQGKTERTREKRDAIADKITRAYCCL